MLKSAMKSAMKRKREPGQHLVLQPKCLDPTHGLVEFKISLTSWFSQCGTLLVVLVMEM